MLYLVLLPKPSSNQEPERTTLQHTLMRKISTMKKLRLLKLASNMENSHLKTQTSTVYNVARVYSKLYQVRSVELATEAAEQGLTEQRSSIVAFYGSNSYSLW